ncbi:hypothetical protein BDV93DRAFT_548593 [Ceratobasidium sp. AG-I]|nr:hypothetical protein BDV93DRAFT_548593 [Ceratobasidium sp. AG-I]
MFSNFSNLLPNLSLGDKDQTPMNNSSTNPFDRLLAVKRRFDGSRTPVPHSAEPQTPEEHPSGTEGETDPEQEAEVLRTAALEKERKKKPLNETFVVVRPPPSVSNHPLNLQLQLIPPSANQIQQTARSASTSTTGSTSSAGGGYSAAGGVPNVPPVSAGLQSKKEGMRQVAEPIPDNELTRVRSNRSDLSLFYSSIGSSASVTSFSTVNSTATSSGSSARRIIPLYNLSAHNVLQNTVQDAGTDATVSRFRKRGIDIVGLGVLEPVEVWGNAPLGGAGGYSIEACGVPISGMDAASDAGHGAPSSAGHGSEEYSPPGQVAHLRESSSRDEPAPSTPILALPKDSGPKKLFGKLFGKKKEPSGSSAGSGSGFAPSATLSPPAQPRASFGSSSRSRPTSIYSVVPPSPATPTTAVVPPTPTTATTSTYLQAPVLGTQASLRAESYPPRGRATAYVWVLRRWTKGGGVLSGLAGAMGVNAANGVDVARLGVEVRFEWVRGKKRRRGAAGDENKTVGVGRRRGVGGGSRPASVADRPVSTFSVSDVPDFSTLGGGESLGVPAGGSRASARSKSPSSYRSGGSNARSRRGSSPSKPRRAVVGREDSSGSSRERSGEDEDEDSEPEDSETPWSCTLRVLSLDPADAPTPTIGSPSTELPAPGGMKLRLAHLVPAPHHPKVIGQFKMPFPLPDVSVQKMELLPRAPGDSFGLGPNGTGPGKGEMILTAEEIKDVVCTTGLWLMVREGFGGLGGKKRKGDGWKIRS